MLGGQLLTLRGFCLFRVFLTRPNTNWSRETKTWERELSSQSSQNRANLERLVFVLSSLLSHTPPLLLVFCIFLVAVVEIEDDNAIVEVVVLVVVQVIVAFLVLVAAIVVDLVALSWLLHWLLSLFLLCCWSVLLLLSLFSSIWCCRGSSESSFGGCNYYWTCLSWILSSFLLKCVLLLFLLCLGLFPEILLVCKFRGVIDIWNISAKYIIIFRLEQWHHQNAQTVSRCAPDVCHR